MGGNITLHVRIGNLPTGLVFTVLKNLAIDVLLGLAFVGIHILGILPDDHQVPLRKSTPIAIIKQDEVSANVVFT